MTNYRSGKIPISIIILLSFLAGCNDDSTTKALPPDQLPPSIDDALPPKVYISTLIASGKVIKGDVDCNDERLTEVDGTFEVEDGTRFTCNLGAVVLGDFVAPISVQRQSRVQAIVENDKFSTSFELTDKLGNSGKNAVRILQSIDSCSSEDVICLNEIDSFDIEDVYQHLENDDKVEAYFNSIAEKATDEVGNAPSSHVDSAIIPAVAPEANNNLNSSFVSANAEASYAYQPSTATQILTRSKLTDSSGVPIANISFFSANSNGMTDENGEFEYKWGDTITFGIDTFEFGKVKGNQVDYKLTDVTDNPVVKDNIQSLIERYATRQGLSLKMSEDVYTAFAQFPNVINELINLSRPNGKRLENSNFQLPNEFEAQFHSGPIADIDGVLNLSMLSASPQMQSIQQTLEPKRLDLGSSEQYVSQTLKQLFAEVDSFHVFNDTGSFYGSTGYTRGMRALNISNEAFPVMMSRTDTNREIPFGQQQIWTREGRPYIAEYKDIKMPTIPLVSKDNATYGFPFVTAGSIGKGKVVFMGNGLYPSILSCPDTYWANRAITIDSTAKTCVANKVENPLHNDHGDMKRFFTNLFQWFNGGKSIQGTNIATNIETGHFAIHQSSLGKEYDFFISDKYGFGNVEKLTSHGFANLSVVETPILILQAFPPMVIKDGRTNLFVSDLENPNLSQNDVTALINYINSGGSVLFMDAIQDMNPEPIGRLADAAGVSLGGHNVTPTYQAFCGSSYYCNTPYPNLHVKSELDMVVLERFKDNDGEQPFIVRQDGSVDWIKDETKIKFEIPTYEIQKLDSEGKPELGDDGSPIMIKKDARIFVSTQEEREAAIQELQAAFEGTPICTNSYEYEFNCIETRKGHGLTVRGNYYRADFDRYSINKDVIDSMVRASNLGANFNALYNHEIYYRTKGKQGLRLSAAELNQAYDNLAVWMWNDNPYRFETEVQDELGFKQAIQFLNCYTNGQHQPDAGQVNCPIDLKASLVANDMLHDSNELSGQLNPSYPLNYMEKPLTRIMLGRSYWDHHIVVDTTQYPGRTPGLGSSGTAAIETDGKVVIYSAGNNQSTGLWAPQLQEVTVTGGVEATISVMMADDLTGRAKHEVSLKRPPRMQTSYHYDGNSLTFTAPYGGLIYVKPKVKDRGEQIFLFDNVEQAAWWKEGAWVNDPSTSVAPIAEVDTGTFIYTTPVNNVRNTNIIQFTQDMNRFANAASDFYGRDEKIENGLHRRFTYEELKGFRHRFVNDVQISIGAAHSGYPVMNTGFNATKTGVPTQAKNDWLLWHEIGHNLASAPFLSEGSTEVTNNLLALYMQELEGRNDLLRMDRIIFDIQKAPLWLKANNGHAWANGNAGIRLVMFGQLKLWAKNHFSLDSWYGAFEHKPDIYGLDEGWNMIKLMHRKARGDKQGDSQQDRNGTNYCSSRETGLLGGDLMMVCSSYVSGYDLGDFFSTWNVGEASMTNPDGTKVYTGGISSSALSMLADLRLNKPSESPLEINSLSYGK
ncbi:SslE/AcfD family lipoprotein zinc metalloprotease [Vibrio coralliirubri]|uniref:SslE/AcfD family lipoprotein zinc metalloprotease n=1 Tax=Vibrio coralliirubri TaxID=1516159 RepID=UPI002FD6129E